MSCEVPFSIINRAYLILVTLIETGVEKVTRDLRPLAVEEFVTGAIAGAAVGATAALSLQGGMKGDPGAPVTVAAPGGAPVTVSAPGGALETASAL